MSGKRYPLRWVKTVTDFGSFVDMVGVSGPREYAITRNDDETFSARLYERMPDGAERFDSTVVSPDGNTLIVVNLKHQVGLDECIEDCEGYENAVNPPPESDNEKEFPLLKTTFEALRNLGVDVMTRTLSKNPFPHINYAVRSDVFGNERWHLLTPEREQTLIARIESDFGVRPSTIELYRAIQLYRATGIDMHDD